MYSPNFPRLIYPIVYGLFWLFIALFALSVGSCTVLLVMEFQGDDAWPSGVFLALLVLYCMSVLWRYASQQAEDRRRQREEEDAGYPADNQADDNEYCRKLN